jgi:uncharacterized protein YdeI (YjbR/CyaY-like superfamily)
MMTSTPVAPTTSMTKATPAPKAFRTPAAFRAWLEKHHATATELELRLFKVHAAHRGLTYRQALDEALCFGWIDGVVHRLDEDSFSQRYTPRKARSAWSRRNLAHVERLTKGGRMAPAGLAAFNARTEARTGAYSFEQERPDLAPAFVKAIKANAAAWAYYQQQAPWYRRTTGHWVMSAKREETREKRLAILIDCSARGVLIPPLQIPTLRTGAGTRP